MPEFQVNYLGCGSATPTPRHLPACQVINFRGRLMMIDCGEGAQLQLRRMHLKFNRINHIFISHLHGDHFLGLPGLLSTLALHETGGTITVHVFEQGAELLDKILSVFCRERTYTLEYDILDPKGGTVLDEKALSVESFPLNHRVPCVGFVFREKAGDRHLIGDMVRYLNIPVRQLPLIKAGADYIKPDGTIVPNERLTTAPTPPRSYAYCSDTAYSEAIVPAVKGVGTLYHEATYCNDNSYKAFARGHSTAAEAGRIATLAGASRLVLGHYSQAYDDDQLFADEAAQTFAGPVIAAREGLVIDL